MQNYEITYLTTEEDSDKIVAKIIAEHEGNVISEEDLGKKRLAYKIKKQEFAHFYTIKFISNGKNVIAINNLIQTQDNILRHLIVTKKIIKALEPITEKKETVAKKTKMVETKDIKIEKQVEAEIKEEKQKKAIKTSSKKTTTKTEIKKVTAKKVKEDKAKETKERLAALDEKLDEILKD